MSRYVDEDGNLTPEGEMSYLRFRAGAKTISQVLESAGPDWLIDEWLVSSATMVTGQPECGKSSLVAGMAAAVSRRDEWLGAEVSTSKSGPVAIVVTDPSDDIQWAKKAVELGVDDWEIIRFSPERWEGIGDLAISMECPLLVFDNITGAIEEGTINEADPNAILRPLGLIIAEGTPVVVIHHSDKSGRKDPMGPTAYRAWRRHGIHITGTGERRTLTREGNFGRFPDVVVHGTAIGSAVEYRLAEVSTSKPNRSSSRLDQNAEIADWVVKNCQGVGVNDVAKRIAKEFPGVKESTRRNQLLQGPLSGMLKRNGQGGSTAWDRKT